MYTLKLSTGEVRDIDGKVIAPCQSADDPAFVAYCEWVTAGNQPTIDNSPSAEQSRAEIIQQLADIDAASVRPLRAHVSGTATDADISKLAELDAKAAALREQLAKG